MHTPEEALLQAYVTACRKSMVPPVVDVMGGSTEVAGTLPYGPRRHDFGPPGGRMAECFSNLGNDRPRRCWGDESFDSKDGFSSPKLCL